MIEIVHEGGLEKIRGDWIILVKMDDALLFSNSISIRLILDTYRSDQFTIVKLVGEHQPSLSPSPKNFIHFSLPPGIFYVRFGKNQS